MKTALSNVIGECVVLPDGQERIDCYLTIGKTRALIGSVTFGDGNTVMTITPGYENWCRQIMRSAKLSSTIHNEELEPV